MTLPLDCHICGAVFTRPQHVTRHARTHSGIKPYPCDLCPEAFQRSDVLKNHRSRCHAGNPALPKRQQVASSTAPRGRGAGLRIDKAKACLACRTRKTKCDLALYCSSCQARQTACEYTHNESSSLPSTLSASDFEKMIDFQDENLENESMFDNVVEFDKSESSSDPSIFDRRSSSTSLSPSGLLFPMEQGSLPISFGSFSPPPSPSQSQSSSSQPCRSFSPFSLSRHLRHDAHSQIRDASRLELSDPLDLYSSASYNQDYSKTAVLKPSYERFEPMTLLLQEHSSEWLSTSLADGASYLPHLVHPSLFRPDCHLVTNLQAGQRDSLLFSMSPSAYGAVPLGSSPFPGDLPSTFTFFHLSPSYSPHSLRDTSSLPLVFTSSRSEARKALQSLECSLLNRRQASVSSQCLPPTTALVVEGAIESPVQAASLSLAARRLRTGKHVPQLVLNGVQMPSRRALGGESVDIA